MTSSRPISPISIYQPQLTSKMSIAHRITGAGTAVGLYASLMAYGLCNPVNKVQLIPDMRKMIREAPLPLVVAGKAAVSGPLAYHYWNGIRHLIWDMGLGLSLKGVYATGWTVNALAILTTGYFSLIK